MCICNHNQSCIEFSMYSNFFLRLITSLQNFLIPFKKSRHFNPHNFSREIKFLHYSNFIWIFLFFFFFFTISSTNCTIHNSIPKFFPPFRVRKKEKSKGGKRKRNRLLNRNRNVGVSHVKELKRTREVTEKFR